MDQQNPNRLIQPSRIVYDTTPALNAAALNTSKSFTTGNTGCTTLRLYIKYIHGAGTSLTVATTIQNPNSLTAGSLDNYSITNGTTASSGLTTVGTATTTITVSADAKFVVDIPLIADVVNITVSAGGSPTTSDKVTVFVAHVR